MHLTHDPVRTFVETIVAQAGYGSLTPEQKAETVLALTMEAQKRVGLDLLDAIDPHSLAQFKMLTETGASEEELAAFFTLRFPDFEARVRQSLANFGAECLTSAQELQDLPPLV